MKSDFLLDLKALLCPSPGSLAILKLYVIRRLWRQIQLRNLPTVQNLSTPFASMYTWRCLFCDFLSQAMFDLSQYASFPHFSTPFFQKVANCPRPTLRRSICLSVSFRSKRVDSFVWHGTFVQPCLLMRKICFVLFQPVNGVTATACSIVDHVQIAGITSVSVRGALHEGKEPFSLFCFKF